MSDSAENTNHPKKPRKELQLPPRARRFCAYIVGIVFFLSGVFKLIDPVGTGLIMDEYYKFLHLGFLSFSAKFMGTAMAFLETMIGVALITGVWRRFMAWLTSAFLGMFTLLTIFLLIFNPQMDCGCFGEVIHLTHLQSFLKNIVLCLLCFAAFWPYKSFGRNRRRKYISFSLVSTAVIALMLYSLLYIPLVDFTDYRPGTRLAASYADRPEEGRSGGGWSEGDRTGGDWSEGDRPEGSWSGSDGFNASRSEGGRSGESRTDGGRPEGDWSGEGRSEGSRSEGDRTDASRSNAAEDIYEAVFIYEKDGRQETFTLDNLPDSTWTFVSTQTTLKNPERDLSAPAFSFTDEAGAYRDDLAAEGQVMCVTIWNPSDVSSDKWMRIYQFVVDATDAGFRPLVVAAMTPDMTEEMFAEAGVPTEVAQSLEDVMYYADYKTLISINRSNSGVTYFSRGYLIKKWSYSNMPDAADLFEQASGDATETLLVSDTTGSLIFQGFLLFSFAVLLLL